MRTLIILSLFQTGILLVLFVQLVLSGEPNNTDAPAVPQSASLPIAKDSSSAAENIAPYPDEALLRQIVREELAAQLDRQPATGIEATRPPTAAELVEFDRRRDAIAGQIDYYASVGRISEQEMLALQGNIAKLDAQSRTEMLRKLTRALNSGGLDGRL